jgi:hypothetical protein
MQQMLWWVKPQQLKEPFPYRMLAMHVKPLVSSFKDARNPATV